MNMASFKNLAVIFISLFVVFVLFGNLTDTSVFFVLLIMISSELMTITDVLKHIKKQDPYWKYKESR